MAERRSWEFECFLWGIHTSGPWTKDNIDTMLGNVGRLPELSGQERIDAEDLGIQKLVEGDTRAAIALADAGCTRAIPALRALAGDRNKYNRLRIATALLGLGDADGSEVAITVLTDPHAGAWIRTSAARLLAEYPSAAGRAALRVAGDDPDPEVRDVARRLLRPRRSRARRGDPSATT
jgi:hypothetical protein